MSSAERGPLLYAYRPIPANPMTVALLLLVLVVTFVIGPIAAGPEGLWPLGGFCFLPVAIILLAMAVFKPSPAFVFENGIEISVPLWRRILGGQRYFAWSEVRDVYPRSYEVAGSFLSPFASSAGTLVHTGIGIETKAGHQLLIRFTPGSIRAFRGDSVGYVEAMTLIRGRFARNGERMVTTARPLSDPDVLAMQARAREPLVSVVGVVFAFFRPPAAAIVVALLPPAASMVRTLQQSEHRNEILSDLAKYQEHLREEGKAPTGSDGSAPEVNPEQG